MTRANPGDHVMKCLLLILIFLGLSCSRTDVTRSTASEGMTLLHIGDSQTEGPFGKLLYHYLAKRDQVHLYGVSGSSPYRWIAPVVDSNGENSWLCQKKARYNDSSYKNRIAMKEQVCSAGDQRVSPFGKLLDTHEPDIVFFQFLGNSMSRSRKEILRDVGALLKMLEDNTKCVFITSPPYHHSLKKRNVLRGKTHDHFLEAIGQRCQVIEGFNMAGFSDQDDYFYRVVDGKRRGDGMHFNAKGAAKYLEFVAAELER